eukprot:3449363-Pleurochrysis_carterae.AAC.1
MHTNTHTRELASTQLAIRHAHAHAPAASGASSCIRRAYCPGPHSANTACPCHRRSSPHA